MATIVLSGTDPIELFDIDISDLFSQSTSFLESDDAFVVGINGEGALAFEGSGFTSFDAHGYALDGTITKLGAIFGSHSRVDWSGLSLSAATLEQHIHAGNSNRFVDDLLGGDDTITLNGAGCQVNGFGGDDTITGKSGDDTIFGDVGKDTLKGGGGIDTIAGGLGADTLTGNAGHDTFYYFATAESSHANKDTITDLSNTADIIDLAAIDADTVAPGDQGFFIAPSFTGVAGALVLTYDAGHDRTVIRGYTDTDSTADLVIYASGDHHTYSNFNF